MAAAAGEPSLFQQIIGIIGDITGIAGGMDTARLNSAQEIQGRLDGLKNAVAALRGKATQLQTEISALQAIRDPNVLDQENQQLLANHQAELGQIRDQLNALQTAMREKVQAFEQAAAGEETAKQAVLTDIAGLLEDISAIDGVLTAIGDDVVNLRRVAGAAAGPAAGPGGPPAGGPGGPPAPEAPGYRPDPPDPANPGRRSGMLGGSRRRKRGGRKTRRRQRGGYTYPRTRTHARPVLKKRKTKNHKRKRGRKTKRKHRRRKH